jgi:hypothetical protein
MADAEKGEEYPYTVKKRGDCAVVAGLHRFHAVTEKGYLVAHEGLVQFWRNGNFDPGGRVVEISNNESGFSTICKEQEMFFAPGEHAEISIPASADREISIFKSG